MILELDVSTGTGPFSDKELTALDHLATGYREGNFILSGDRGALEALSKKVALHARSRAAYKNALGKLPESLGLAARFNRRFRIYKNTDCTQCIKVQKPPEPKFIHEFRLKDFEKTANIQKVELLAESDYDCSIYEKLLHSSLRAEGMHGVKFSFTGRGLGGTNLAIEVGKLRKANDRFFFVFVDSDRGWSGGSLGDTAKQTIAAYNEDTPRGACYVLPVREIENLAPIKLPKVCKLAKANSVSEILEFSSVPPRETWKYIDLKEGLLVRKWKAVPKDAPDRVCIEQFCQKDARTLEAYCSCPTACSEKCHCVILTGFGGEITAKFEDFLAQELRGNNIRSHYSAEQWSIIRDLTIEAVSWTCSRDPIYT